MVKALLLLVVEIAVVVLLRSGAWNLLVRQIGEGEVSGRRAKAVAASLIRTSGHLWLLLGFVPTAVLVMVFVSVEELDTPTADLLAVSALALIVWCGWKALFYYRWAWRIAKIDLGED
jgi:hypothetical protein